MGAGAGLFGSEGEAAPVGVQSWHRHEESAGDEKGDAGGNGGGQGASPLRFERNRIGGGEDDPHAGGTACQEARHDVGGRLGCGQVPRRLAQLVDETDRVPAAFARGEVCGDTRPSSIVQLAVGKATQAFERRVSENPDHAEFRSRSLRIFLARCSLLAEPCVPMPINLPISSWE